MTSPAPLLTSPVVVGQADNSGYCKLTVHYTGSTNERLSIWMVPLASGQSVPATTPVVTPLGTWAQTPNRQACTGDIDAYASIAPSDSQQYNGAWSTQISTASGKTIKPLDDLTADGVVPGTLNLPLNAGEQVTWAKLILSLKASSGTTGSDSLYLDSTTGQSYTRLGWSTIDITATAREIIFTPQQLQLLQDGKLNFAVSGNTSVDWAEIQFATDASDATINDPGFSRSKSKMSRSTDVVMLIEGTQVDLYAGGLTSDPVKTTNPRLDSARHGSWTNNGRDGLTNVGFFDGHIAAVNTSLYSNWPAGNLYTKSYPVFPLYYQK